MNWEVYVLDELKANNFSEQGSWKTPLPEQPKIEEITPDELEASLRDADTVLLDVTTHANYITQHIDGAKWVIRSQLPQQLTKLTQAKQIVLTCGSSLLASFAAKDLQQLINIPIKVLQGGTANWITSGKPVHNSHNQLLSEPIDRYKRPYEGTNNGQEAMQAYLNWEFGLVKQLANDATHGFYVI